MPLAFHAGFNWEDGSMAQLNRFLSMHALSFVHCNLIHMTNWVDQRPAGAVPQAQGDLGRERASPGCPT